MAWTAEVINKSLDSDILNVTVRYTDGIKTIEETYRSSGAPNATWIQNTVHQKISWLEALETAEGNIAIGAVTPINPDTPANIEWREKLAKLRALDLLLKYNIVSGTDPKISAIKTYLQNNWETMLGL